MLHRIDTAALGPTGTPMAKAVASCVHCGFCLPACPTYQLLGDEMDSPRGRIVLMKSVLEGTLSADEAAPHVDRCLGCLACVSACPSGVAYGNLLTPYRARVEAQRRRSAGARLVRWLALGTIPDVGRFRLAARAARWTRGLASLAPRSLRALWALLPDGLPDGGPCRPSHPPSVVAARASCCGQAAPRRCWRRPSTLRLSTCSRPTV
ncbi:MAG: 4Fe-4S dicluster domain-containing protein [Vicinamibacterales bacterium]